MSKSDKFYYDGVSVYELAGKMEDAMGNIKDMIEGADKEIETFCGSEWKGEESTQYLREYGESKVGYREMVKEFNVLVKRIKTFATEAEELDYKTANKINGSAGFDKRRTLYHYGETMKGGDKRFHKKVAGEDGKLSVDEMLSADDKIYRKKSKD